MWQEAIHSSQAYPRFLGSLPTLMYSGRRSLRHLSEFISECSIVG